MKEYPYYPGCSLEGTAKEFNMSVLEVFRRLDASLKEIDDWACCGASTGHFINHLLSLALPTRTLNLVRKQGGDSVAVSCAACYSRLMAAVYELEKDAELRKKVDDVVGEEYKGGVEVKHILEIMCNDFGVSRIAEAVTHPLKDLNVVCYYGCLLVRPPKVVHFDDVEDPQTMDRILTTTGANVIQWPHKTECCGASLTLSRADLVMELTMRILREAKDAGADAIAVACPLCQANLDLRQLDLKSKGIIDYDIPIVYFTQLLGLAFGIPWKDLGLNRIMVSADETMKKFTKPVAVG